MDVTNFRNLEERKDAEGREVLYADADVRSFFVGKSTVKIFRGWCCGWSRLDNGESVWATSQHNAYVARKLYEATKPQKPEVSDEVLACMVPTRYRAQLIALIKITVAEILAKRQRKGPRRGPK